MEQAVQTSLRGVWSQRLGCPHRHSLPEGIDRCDQNEMRACIYETGKGHCETFRQILEEWRIQYEICPECGQVRSDDERVRNGMKCAVCAY